MNSLLLCHIDASTAPTTLDCSSDIISLQHTPGSQLPDMASAVQSATHSSSVTPLPHPSDLGQPHVKKRGRGRPPMYNLNDRRKAQLREVSISNHFLLASVAFEPFTLP